MITYCGTGCGMSIVISLLKRIRDVSKYIEILLMCLLSFVSKKKKKKMRTVLLFGFLILFNHLSSLPKLYTLFCLYDFFVFWGILFLFIPAQYTEADDCNMEQGRNLLLSSFYHLDLLRQVRLIFR